MIGIYKIHRMITIENACFAVKNYKKQPTQRKKNSNRVARNLIKIKSFDPLP